MTESIPSSAKFALAVVDLDQSHPEYHLLFPEWQKYLAAVKYEYLNTNISRQVNILQNLSSSLFIKKDGRSDIRKARDILNLAFPREVRAEKLHRTRLVRGGGGEVNLEFKGWVNFCESRAG